MKIETIPIVLGYDRLTDGKPENHSQWLGFISDIERCIKVCIAGIPTPTTEEIPVSDSKISTVATDFATVFWVNPYNNNIFLNSFVFDKGLELPECPRMQLSVEFSSFVLPDMLDVLHCNDVSILHTFNNFFAYLMVGITHEPCPSATEFPKMLLGRLRAFALKLGNNSLMSLHLRYDTIKELPIRCSCNVLYSDINAQNTLMLSRAYWHINVFGKAQAKESSVMFIDYQYTFTNIPFSISFSITRIFNIKLLSALDSCNTQSTILIREASWWVVFDKISGNYGFCLGFLNHTDCLFYTGTSELGMKTKRTDMLISHSLKLIGILDIKTPSNVDTILQRFVINNDSIMDFLVNRQFQLDNSSAQHNSNIGKEKHLKAMSSLRERQFVPLINDVGFLASISW